MSPTFSSLSIYNYRVYFAGALVSNVGTWMGRVAQDWLVLTQLTDNDPIALGVVTGLQFAPMVLLAPWAGMVADRFRKRRILFATQSMLAVTSLLTGVLVVTGVVRALARLPAGAAAGPRDRHRQPGPPDVRLRDGAARPRWPTP